MLTGTDHGGEPGLQAINGIGPAIEKRLNKAEIFTVSQLAGMNAADLVGLDIIGVSTEAAQKWIDEAARILLASESEEDKKARTGNGLHYASFHVKLTIDEEARVRRTEIQPVSSEQPAYKAAGWRPEDIIAYIEERAKLSKVISKPEPAPISDEEKTAVHKKTQLQKDENPKITLTDVSLVDKEGNMSPEITFRGKFWHLILGWVVEPAVGLLEKDAWLATLYLNPIGKGEELAFRAITPVRVAEGSRLSETMRRYQAVIEIDPAGIDAPLPRVYRLGVSIVGVGEAAARLPMTYQEGEIVSILEPAPAD